MGRQGKHANKNEQKKKRGSAGQNRAAGEEYLEKNAHKTGVYVTEDGLHFEDLVVGSGAMPRDGDSVRIDQRAWLVNGTSIETRSKPGPLIHVVWMSA